VCQEMNQELDRGESGGNGVLESMGSRILATLRDEGLYSGEDWRGNGFRRSTMEFQLVRYRRGGKFRYHFDEDFNKNALPLTYMIYMSDKAEAGGGARASRMRTAGRDW